VRRLPDRIQADAVVRGVAQEIQRIGAQRDRAREDASRPFHAEHDGIDREHCPQHPPVGAVGSGGLAVIVVATACYTRCSFRVRALQRPFNTDRP
jgi:hypothetical protein